MADPVIITITDATVALGSIPAGYPTTPIDPATLTDHKCQVTRAEITATGASTTTDRAATFCAPAATVQVPAASTFALALEGFQDWTATAGISAWLFKNDATEQAFALYLEGEEDPSAIGTVVVVAGAFAGSPQVPLTFAVELPIQGYPDIKDSAGVSIRTDVVATAAAAETSKKKSAA